MLTDRNKNRPGYKKTPVGWIPEEWTAVLLSDMCAVRFSGVDKKCSEGEQTMRLCNYTDVYYNDKIIYGLSFMTATASQREIEQFELKAGDVLLTKDSETADDIAKCAYVPQDLPGVLCGYHLALLRPDQALVSGKFLSHKLNAYETRQRFSRFANGVTRFGLNLETFSEFSVALPPLPEQKKIAEILSTWDEGIEQTRQLIAAANRRKKALMQKLLTGKRRLPGFDEKWSKKNLSQFLRPVSRPAKKPTSSYIAVGIRSHGKGTFQRIVEEPEKVMMDTLYQLHSGDLVVNITFAWEGAIAIADAEDEGCFVSHRFPAFEFIERKASRLFFMQLVRTQRFVWNLGLISPGGAGRNRVLNKTDFMKMSVQVPEYDEQQAIATVLTTADEEIAALESKLAALEKQKRGLMQKLLTGEVRVKT